MNAIELHLNPNNISFIFFTISFSILGVLYAFHYKYAKELVLSILGPIYANKYLRDENVFKRRTNMIFTIFMILNISMFLWTIQTTFSGSALYLLVTTCFVASYYIIKYLCIQFLGSLLKMRQIAILAVFFTTIFDKVFALLLLPCLVFFHYFTINLREYSINTILLVFIIFFLLKIFWMARIGIKSFGLSRFYLFLYICILEFFPLLLVYREIILL